MELVKLVKKEKPKNGENSEKQEKKKEFILIDFLPEKIIKDNDFYINGDILIELDF